MNDRDFRIKRKHKKPLMRTNTDSTIQLTVWELKCAIEESRNLSTAKSEQMGMGRVRQVRSNVRMFEALEKLLKIPLGVTNGKDWIYNKSYHTHNLATLYAAIEQKYENITNELDKNFQEVVLARGLPKFGHFTLPIELLTSNSKYSLIIDPGESTYPFIKDLPGYLEEFDTSELYYQSYLGDAVKEFSDAYLAFLIDVGPFLQFIEASLDTTIMTWIESTLAIKKESLLNNL